MACPGCPLLQAGFDLTCHGSDDAGPLLPSTRTDDTEILLSCPLHLACPFKGLPTRSLRERSEDLPVCGLQAAPELLLLKGLAGRVYGFCLQVAHSFF